MQDGELFRSMTCDFCGGKKLKRIRKGEYVCEYCGSRFLYTADDDTDDEQVQARLMAIFAQAEEYEENGDLENELQTLTKGLETAPDNCTLMLKIGRAYRKLGEPKMAYEYYKKAEQLDPNDPVVYNNLGSLYLTQECYDEARSYMEKCMRMIEADPLSASIDEIAVIYNNYALSVGMAGDKDRARKYLKQAKEKGCAERHLSYTCGKLGFRLKEILK